MEQLRIDLLAMVKDERRDQKKQIQQLVQEIDNSFGEEQHWKEFAQAFEQVHQQFFEKLKSHSADLTAADLRLIALMKMNLNSAEIAVMLGISTDSLRVARYRLRKKLQMEQGDNLTFFYSVALIVTEAGTLTKLHTLVRFTVTKLDKLASASLRLVFTFKTLPNTSELFSLGMTDSTISYSNKLTT